MSVQPQKRKQRATEDKSESVGRMTTRRRLIECAIEVFGAYGFEATTTRMLVQRAGTQLTAISYYFVNKEGLYRAAAEHIAQTLEARLDEGIGSAQALLAAPQSSRSELVDAVCTLLDHFAALLVGPAIPDTWARFVNRELSEPSLSFNLLFSSMQPFGQTLCQFIAKLRGSPADHPEVVLCMLTLIGQVLVFRSDRAAALKFLNWPKFGAKQLDSVQAVVRQNVQKLLAGSV